MEERIAAPEPLPPEPARVPLPRWVTPVLTLAAVGMLPWTLWLTFTLPERHVTVDYDVAWVGFDFALIVAFAATSWCAVRGSQWLVPFAAATGALLLADAWFDVVTSTGGMDRMEAILEALFAELPLAAICGYIVYDAERFRTATVVRYSATLRRLRGRAAA
jgi:hypothetical protein